MQSTYVYYGVIPSLCKASLLSLAYLCEVLAIIIDLSFRHYLGWLISACYTIDQSKTPSQAPLFSPWWGTFQILNSCPVSQIWNGHHCSSYIRIYNLRIVLHLLFLWVFYLHIIVVLECLGNSCITELCLSLIRV